MNNLPPEYLTYHNIRVLLGNIQSDRKLLRQFIETLRDGREAAAYLSDLDNAAENLEALVNGICKQHESKPCGINPRETVGG